jgi:hypothetical protein
VPCYVDQLQDNNPSDEFGGILPDGPNSCAKKSKVTKMAAVAIGENNDEDAGGICCLPKKCT